MAIEVKLPELGENITSAKVLDVLVKPGDSIEKDQALLTLESDKAEFDLPSPAAGKVAELLVKKGDEVEVGQVILRLDGAASEAPAQQKKSPAEKPAAAAQTPARAERKREEEIAEVDAESGEGAGEEASPGAGEEAAEGDGESSEAAPRAAKGSSTARPQPAKSPRQPDAGASEAKVRKAPPAPARETKAETGDADGGSQAQQPSAAKARVSVAAAPSVRRLARELGVELAEVKGSEAGGRISAEDVYRHVRARLTGTQDGAKHADGAQEHDYSRWGEVRIEEMSTVRRRTAEQMTRAWSRIPHVTHHDYADISELERLRRQFSPRVERAGGKLTITAVLLKVLGSALRRYPKFNASVDMEKSQIIYKTFVNVGVAVDTERGLLVPVIRNADEKNIVELALELHEFSEAARTRKLRPDMLQGATFTVTNLGGIGGTHFSPLINPPEVAVLGVARAAMRPVWANDKFEPHFMLPLSVTYDHRIIDGADAARFMRWVCEALEEPFLMDLEGD